MGFLKKVAKAIAAPVVAPVQAVQSVAKGENVLQSAVNAVTKTFGASNSLLESGTGGAASGIASQIPVIGGSASGSLLSANQIVQSGGNSEWAALQDYYVQTGKVGGVVGGASYAAGAFGLTAPQTVGGLAIGSRLLKGDTSALYELFSGYSGIPLSPKVDYEDAYLPDSAVLPNAFKSASTPIGVKKSSPLIPLALVIGGVYFLTRRKK